MFPNHTRVWPGRPLCRSTIPSAWFKSFTTWYMCNAAQVHYYCHHLAPPIVCRGFSKRAVTSTVNWRHFDVIKTKRGLAGCWLLAAAASMMQHATLPAIFLWDSIRHQAKESRILLTVDTSKNNKIAFGYFDQFKAKYHMGVFSFFFWKSWVVFMTTFFHKKFMKNHVDRDR